MRFTVRDLFWLTVVVALALGWAINNENWLRRQQSWLYQQQVTKRHAEALRMAPANAEINIAVYRPTTYKEDGSDFVPVDWELATREIP